jgi:hypothetical protein
MAHFGGGKPFTEDAQFALPPHETGRGAHQTECVTDAARRIAEGGRPGSTPGRIFVAVIDQLVRGVSAGAQKIVRRHRDS